MIARKRTARQASRAAAALYPGLPGDAPVPPPVYGPLRQGYAWDMHGNEVRLMHGRQYLRRRNEGVLGEIEIGDRVIIDDELTTDNEE